MRYLLLKICFSDADTRRWEVSSQCSRCQAAKATRSASPFLDGAADALLAACYANTPSNE
jgi:hypothetical protein